MTAVLVSSKQVSFEKSTAAQTVKQSEVCITRCRAMLSTLLYIGVSCSVDQIAVMLPGSGCCNPSHKLRHVFACCQEGRPLHTAIIIWCRQAEWL